MIILFKRRPIAEVSAQGYSTEDIEDEFDDDRVSVKTNSEVDRDPIGGAPRQIMDTVESLKEE